MGFLVGGCCQCACPKIAKTVFNTKGPDYQPNNGSHAYHG